MTYSSKAPTSSQPVLFHDLNGDDWKEVLRRKLAPHLAVLLENAAYTATLALFLLAESDADREEALHELGITGDDVDAIRAGDRGCLRRGEAATAPLVLRNRRHSQRASTSFRHSSSTASTKQLVRAGLPADIAGQVVERGGGQAVRGDVSPDGALSLLADNGVDLQELDRRLRAGRRPRRLDDRRRSAAAQ